MSSVLKTLLVVVAVLVVAVGLFAAGMWVARAPGVAGLPSQPSTAPGYYGYGAGPLRGDRGGSGAGPGEMPRTGYGFGGAMLGGPYADDSAAVNAVPLTVQQARDAAQTYVQASGLQGLELGEVMIFDHNAYVVVKETSTGMGAFELLVDPVSQLAYPERGPNMMWNLKYGALNHAGMLGLSSANTAPADVASDMAVSPDQAVQDAQAFLDKAQPGAAASRDPVKFYGYYTLDFTRNGAIAGMLSVNGQTGQVFLHTWHGDFVEEAD
jgi:hypothetical protein